VNSLPKPVTRQRRDCDLNPGRSAPESSTLATRLASHALRVHAGLKPVSGVAQVTIRRKKSSIFVISRPDVYVSSSADTYVIFGEARVRGFSFVLPRDALPSPSITSRRSVETTYQIDMIFDRGYSCFRAYPYRVLWELWILKDFWNLVPNSELSRFLLISPRHVDRRKFLWPF